MRKTIVLILLVSSGIGLKAQTRLDSLYLIWQNEALLDSVRVNAYANYILKGFVYSQPDSANKLAEELLTFGLDNNNLKAQAQAYLYQGLSWHNRAYYTKAIDYYFKSLKIEEELGNQNGIARCYNNLGLIYESQTDYGKALDYYASSLKIYQEIGYIHGAADARSNMGNVYYRQGNYTLALDFYTQSLTDREKIKDQSGIATSLNNIGLIYEEEGDYPKALDYYKRSLGIAENAGDSLGVVYYLNNIGNIYLLQGNYPEAIDYCSKALQSALVIDARDMQQVAYRQLYQISKALGNDKKALEYHELMIALKDSLFNEKNTKKLTQLDMQFEYDKKEAAARLEQEKKDAIAAEELRRNKLIRNGFIGGFAVMLLFALVFFSQRNRIKAGKRQSDELLLNILPAEVAEELKAKGKAAARGFDMVSILFTDFKGFTEQSAKLSAADLVNEINTCFEAFDGIMGKYNIEKIKTIGDAYMAAGGLPVPSEDSVKNTVLAALEMQDFIEKRYKTKDARGESAFQMRVGIHIGPVVAGIVGVKKFQYDIWGDTVNTASRIESNGEVGKVNISAATYELLKPDPVFTFESRGKIEARGKGEIEMLFVKLRE